LGFRATLGETGISEVICASVTCEVLEPSQICLSGQMRGLLFLKEYGELAVKLVQALSLRNELNVADQFTFTPAWEGFARLLLELSDQKFIW
jgi:hypothetical protein